MNTNTHAKPRLLVLGIGQCGCRTLQEMANDWRDCARMVAVDTDGRALPEISGIQNIQIGSGIIRGMGTAGDPRVGRRAAEADLAAIRPVFEQTDLVFLIVGLGGGTGTGAAPLLAEEARKSGALTFCFAALPFEFEGQRRVEYAQNGLAALQTAADAVISLPNQRLVELIDDHANIAEAFRKATSTLATGLRSVWRIISRQGTINVDLPHITAMARQRGCRCVFVCAEGTGPDKIAQTLQAIREHPLLDHGQALAETESFLVSIMAGHDLALRDIDRLMSGITKMAGAHALMLVGVCCEPEWQDRIWATLLVAEQQTAAVTLAKTKSKPAKSENLPTADAQRPLRQEDLFDKPRPDDRFKDTEATMINGKNLDTPTFHRRGIIIQKTRQETVSK